MRLQRGAGGVAVESYAVEATSVHRHPGVMEIVYVLSGELSVRVSSERYVLEAGDFAVLNAGDTHVFEARDECLITVMQLELESFLGGMAQLHGAIFACESFDLPRYLGTETYLREQLIAIFRAAPEARRPLAVVLLSELLDHYGVEHYYDRRRTLSESRRSLIRSITTLLREHAAERNVLDLVSEEMHYSKSALSRIARETTGMSFSDLLTNIRLWNAEVLLIETEDTMVSVAAACGFSDVKYFTRAFRAWFECTPSQYRRENQGRVHGGESAEVCTEIPEELLDAHLCGELPRGRPPRRSATPIDVVTAAAERETFLGGGGAAAGRVAARLPAGEIGGASVQGGAHPPRRPHLLPIRIDGVERNDWRQLLQFTDRALYRPVLIVSASRPDEAESVVSEFATPGVPGVELWVSYRFGDEELADELAARLTQRHGVAALPMLTG